MRIGKDQLRMLIVLASPTCILLTPNRSSAGMVKRGLLWMDEHGGCCIAPAGLRVLADEMEAGRVADALTTMKKDVAEQRAKLAAKRAA